MGLFSSNREKPLDADLYGTPSIPIEPVDLSKRYDVYCGQTSHDRLYENVRFICIRTFDRISKISPGLLGGFLEIEASDGTRALLPSFHIRMICEHGTKPLFKILRRRRRWED